MAPPKSSLALRLLSFPIHFVDPHPAMTLQVGSAVPGLTKSTKKRS